MTDVFALHARLLDRTRTIIGDPSYGVVPALPAAPADHRLFKAKLAQPPRMWSTHPSNDVREANAKQIYLPAPLDDRSGWLLFNQPAALRARVTAELYERRKDADGDLETPLIDATLAALEAELDPRYLDPRYRGVYLGRSVVSTAVTAVELYGDEPAPDAILPALDALYPAQIAEQVQQFRELCEQHDLLLALQRGLLEMPGGVVRHRGREYHRREIPKLIAEADHELAEVRRALCEHDRQVRTAHVAAARTLSPTSESYLRGLVAILHYADHREADLKDAAGSLQTVLAIALADRRIGSDDRDRVLAVADVAFSVLRDIHREANLVELGALAGKLEAESFKARLEPLRLNAPNETNLGSWLNAIGSRIANATDALSAVSNAALDELLRTEDDVARRVRAAARGAPAAEIAPAEPASAADTPALPRAPAGYAVLLPGKERPRQTLGWWDRFQIADGLVATAARFLVAAAIIGCVVWVGQFT